MITIKHKGEDIAYAKNCKVVDAYFKLQVSHNGGNERYFGRPLKSRKYDIFVVLEDDGQTWLKNQSIVFKKTLELKG